MISSHSCSEPDANTRQSNVFPSGLSGDELNMETRIRARQDSGGTERQLLESHEQPRGGLSAVFPGPTSPLHPPFGAGCPLPAPLHVPCAGQSVGTDFPRWSYCTWLTLATTSRLLEPGSALGEALVPWHWTPTARGALLPAPASAAPLLNARLGVREPRSSRVTLTQRRRRTNGCSPGAVPRRRFRGRGSGTGPVWGTRGGWGMVLLPLCLVPRAAPSPGQCPSPAASGTAPATRTNPSRSLPTPPRAL